MSGLKLAVLVSGSGSNLQSIIDASEKGDIKSQITCVISNKADAFGLVRAKNHQIPDVWIDGKRETYNEQLLEVLLNYDVDLVVLAGYLKIVDQSLLKVYKGRVINIHPSLLPKFGGKGYYGIKVHQAVLAAGEAVSGATVHYVDIGIDTGEMIIQESVPVCQGDTPEILQQRVLNEVEHHLLVKAIKKLEGEI